MAENHVQQQQVQASIPHPSQEQLISQLQNQTQSPQQIQAHTPSPSQNQLFQQLPTSPPQISQLVAQSLGLQVPDELLAKMLEAKLEDDKLVGLEKKIGEANIVGAGTGAGGGDENANLISKKKPKKSSMNLKVDNELLKTDSRTPRTPKPPTGLFSFCFRY